MPREVDIDELADSRGNLFGRAPSQAWVRPKTVQLRKKSFRNLLEGTLKNGSELEFAIPWSVPRTMLVKPSASILQQFLSLAAASDEEIHTFALKCGPLLIFCEAREADDHAIIIESCEVWRYFAVCIRSLLRIASSIQGGRPARTGDWDAIGMAPIAVLRTDVNNFDWLNPSALQAEKSWKVMVSIIQHGRNRDHAMWVNLLNTLLVLGRVRPWLDLEPSGRTSRPKLLFTGPNLLSYLALQTVLTASRQDSFAICSYCNSEYFPAARAPKAGQNNYCPECRQAGVPNLNAQRRRREREREGG